MIPLSEDYPCVLGLEAGSSPSNGHKPAEYIEQKGSWETWTIAYKEALPQA